MSLFIKTFWLISQKLETNKGFEGWELEQEICDNKWYSSQIHKYWIHTHIISNLQSIFGVVPT